MDEEMMFGISWNVISSSEGFYYGTVTLIIDNQCFPKGISMYRTINVIFSHMKDSMSYLNWSDGSNFEDLGNVVIDYNQLNDNKIPNILSIGLAELEDCFIGFEKYGGIYLKLGFCGEFERLFYNDDNGSTFREIRLKRGSVKKVINSLPNEDELEKMLITQKPYFTAKLIDY